MKMKEYLDKQELMTMLLEMKATTDEDFEKSYGNDIIYTKGQLDIINILIGCIDNLTVQKEE
jgi:hypothetical protein